MPKDKYRARRTQHCFVKFCTLFFNSDGISLRETPEIPGAAAAWEGWGLTNTQQIPPLPPIISLHHMEMEMGR